MTSLETVKDRTSMVLKRYSKTLKGTAQKPKVKVKVRPVLRKNKIGAKVKVTF